jgi:hypothetical protein
MRKILAALFSLAFISCAGAQSVQQSGNVTPNHPAAWATNGVIKDGGTPQNGALTGIGITNNGIGFCQNSGPITGPYQQLCFSDPSSGAAQLSIFPYGGAPTPSFAINVNGTSTIFPGSGGLFPFTEPAIKLPVDAASTGSNVNIASAPSTLDGVTLHVASGSTPASRLLLKDQSIPSQVGIYQFNGTGSALTRTSDFNTNGQVVQGTRVCVTQGTLNAGNCFWVTTPNPITVGTTGIAMTPGVVISGAFNSVGLTINTPATTTDLGIAITQSGPTNGGALNAEQIFNLINVTSDQTNTGTGCPGGCVAEALRIQYSYGGSAAVNSRQAFDVQGILSAPTNAASNTSRFYVAGIIQQTCASGDNGTSSTIGADAQGACIGFNPASGAVNGASNLREVTAMEADVAMDSSTSSWSRQGVRIAVVSFTGNDGSAQGTEVDEALQFVNGIPSAPWKVGISFDASYGYPPLATTGTAIKTVGAQTIGSFIDASGATISDFFLNSNGFTVNGVGFTTITQLPAANTSADGLALVNTTAATSGNQQFSPRLRLTGQGWKTASTAASETVDWIIENQPAPGSTAPGTNLVFSWQSNGVGYGAAFEMESTGAVNVSLGYQIAGSATSGNVLRGDGTNFISATLAIGDLATIATNTVVVNNTSGSAAPTAQAVSSCAAAGDALIWTTNAGFGCNTSITAAAVPASGITGTTLPVGIITSSLTKVGALASGSLASGFTAITGPLGGTGLTTAAVGDIMYASATTPAWSRLADVATGQVLVSGGVNTAPAWSASPTLSTSLTVPLVIGGTAVSSSLVLESTSGVGSSDSIALKTGSQVTRELITTAGDIGFGDTPTSNGAGYTTLSVGGSTAGVVEWQSNGTRYAQAYTTSGQFSIGGITSGTIVAITSGSTVATFSSSGTTMVLASAAESAATCYNTGTAALTYDTSGTICGISFEAAKNLLPSSQWIAPEKALDGLMRLRSAIPYRYKEQYGDHGKAIHISLMADDVAAMNPECGDYGGPNGSLSNYSDRCIEAYLVASVQALKLKLDKVEERK